MADRCRMNTDIAVRLHRELSVISVARYDRLTAVVRPAIVREDPSEPDEKVAVANGRAAFDEGDRIERHG